MAAVSARDLERIGLSLEPDEFERLVAEAVRGMPPARRPRDTDIPQFDRAALERGGLTFAPLLDALRSPLAGTAAKYAALLATARSVAEVARLLGVDPSRIR